MKDKDIQFLAHADMVSKSYRRRIAKLQEDYVSLTDYEVGMGSAERLHEIVKLSRRLKALKAKSESHGSRWRELQRQRDREIAIKKLCADASKRSGVDGISFMRKVRRCIEKGRE